MDNELLASRSSFTPSKMSRCRPVRTVQLRQLSKRLEFTLVQFLSCFKICTAFLSITMIYFRVILIVVSHSFNFIPPPGQTDGRRHYGFYLSARSSIRPSVHSVIRRNKIVWTWYFVQYIHDYASLTFGTHCMIHLVDVCVYVCVCPHYHLTRGQSNLTKSASRGPIPRLG